MSVNGLRAHLDHLWDMEVGCRFQTSPYDLRIVVKMAQKLVEGISGSYWEPNYASEWTRSQFKPLLGHVIVL